MKTYSTKFRPIEKAVPKHYVPVPPFIMDSHIYDTIEEGVLEFIKTKLPPLRVCRHFFKDSFGGIIIGYKYVGNLKVFDWYGLPMAFEIVQNHPSIDTLAAIGWEQQAIHTFHEMR